MAHTHIQAQRITTPCALSLRAVYYYSFSFSVRLQKPAETRPGQQTCRSHTTSESFMEVQWHWNCPRNLSIQGKILSPPLPPTIVCNGCKEYCTREDLKKKKKKKTKRTCGTVYVCQESVRFTPSGHGIVSFGREETLFVTTGLSSTSPAVWPCQTYWYSPDSADISLAGFPTRPTTQNIR